jgi:hypothetical protein
MHRLDDMIMLCHDEAERIESMQATLVRLGMLKEPDPGQTQRRETFLQMLKVIELVRMCEPEFRDVVARKLGARKRGEDAKGGRK